MRKYVHVRVCVCVYCVVFCIVFMYFFKCVTSVYVYPVCMLAHVCIYLICMCTIQASVPSYVQALSTYWPDILFNGTLLPAPVSFAIATHRRNYNHTEET